MVHLPGYDAWKLAIPPEYEITPEEERRLEAIDDLQRARAAATQRFLALTEVIKAEAGVTGHIIRKSLTGRVNWTTPTVIEAPEGRTRRQLYIVAHECAHVALKHYKARIPSYLKEHEAELWAHAALCRHGVPVPRQETERAKRYVARKIRNARKVGLKHLSPAAAAFARKKL